MRRRSTSRVARMAGLAVACWTMGWAAGWTRGGEAALGAAAQEVRAEQKADRVVIEVAGQLFTEYLYAVDLKYPYFYPVNGPRTGRSVTIHKTEPYPHHSSLFFGCDRVNGGNYWQEGLDRGRIVSQGVRLVRPAGDRVVFEQDCLWQRPGAEAPFEDHRVIAICAPSAEWRWIDFDITLKARDKVRIEKTNHSLFSARVAPEISVQGGGTLINAHGEEGERGTFGRPAAWADYRGTRADQTEGLAIFCHPQNRWFPTPWFTRDYGFFSPTPMFWLEDDRLELEKGERLHFRYRVLVHGGAPTQAELKAQYQAWAGTGGN